ncbi:MAG: hypothetical protein ACI8TA_003474 [Cyclobacteriaceae bacterium]|jgi:hypothetical protein
MGLTVKRVSSRSELKQFVKFPFKLFKGDDNWVPPLIRDELAMLDEKKNPSMAHCETSFWLVFENQEVVGRIGGIIHEREMKEDQLVRFGWLDFVDDVEVSGLLLKTVEDWGKEKGAVSVHGPLGFTDMDFEGMLIEGFDEPSTIATIYNYPYYNEHLLTYQFKKSTDWVEIEVKIPEEGLKKLERTARLVATRFNLKVVEFKNTRQMKAYGHKMFDALNKSYADLYGFHPLSIEEIDNYLKQYFSFLIPGFISIVVDQEDNVVAFGITMPSLSEAFKKAKGKLFPFGFVHILRALKKNTMADLYLVGVIPEYQKMGVTAMVIDQIYKTFQKWGIKKVFTNPVLENNRGMLNHFSDFKAESRIRKRRRCYVKKI